MLWGGAGDPHQESGSCSTPKSPTWLCHPLCQVLPAHLLKDHFCSKKLQLEVLTLLQKREMEAQGFLQLRNYNQISPTSDLSVPQ